LSDAVADDCNLDVVQSVQEQLSEMVQEQKAAKEEDPPAVSKTTVKKILQSCGVSNSHLTAFEEQYDSEFGADTEISPQNLVDPKQLEVRTPDVIIRVSPERGDLVETRVIDGVKYILIRADEGVEVNGVGIHIT
jgi:hypothetical protein